MDTASGPIARGLSFLSCLCGSGLLQIMSLLAGDFLSCLCGSGQRGVQLDAKYSPGFSELPMRQWTTGARCAFGWWFSELPMRQWTCAGSTLSGACFSELPMRQWTSRPATGWRMLISELPMRQWTFGAASRRAFTIF